MIALNDDLIQKLQIINQTGNAKLLNDVNVDPSTF